MFWTLNFAVDKNGGPFCKLLLGNTALYTLKHFVMILSEADLFWRLLKYLFIEPRTPPLEQYGTGIKISVKSHSLRTEKRKEVNFQSDFLKRF